MMQELIDAGGWKELKKIQQEEMAVSKNGLSMEGFRQEIIQKVKEICLQTFQAVGYDDPGEYLEIGTRGWDSDIDLIYAGPAEMTETMQVIQKLLFDAIFEEVLKMPSGRLLDTELYLRHAASVFNTEKFIVTEQGYREYARIELYAVALQFYLQYQDLSSLPLSDFVERFICEVDSSLRPCVMETFQIVSEIGKEIEFLVRRQMLQEAGVEVTQGDLDEIMGKSSEIELSDPKAKNRAVMECKTVIFLKIAKNIDRYREKIEAIQQKTRQQANVLPQQAEELERKIEKLQLKIAMCATIRNYFFDEGYISQGAFVKICTSFEGQAHKRIVEGLQEKMLEERQSIIKKELTPLEAVAGRDPFRLPSRQQERSSFQQTVVSALENLAMYQGHFGKSREKAPELVEVQKAFVNQSKYSERILQALLIVLEALPDTQSQKGVVQEEVETLLFQAAELEKVKRQKQLNKTTTKVLLLEKLTKDRSVAEKEQIEDQIEQLLNRIETRGALHSRLFDATILPQDLYLDQVSMLAQFGLAEVIGEDRDGNPILRDSELNHIIRARCGLDVDSVDIQGLIKQSEKITLKELLFTTKDRIEWFNTRMEHLVILVYNLATMDGLLADPRLEPTPENHMQWIWKKILQTDRGGSGSYYDT